MNKNIIVTLIAGTFFAASLVAPAFATNNTAAEVRIASQQPPLDPTIDLPKVELPKQLPSLDKIAERLKNLDVGAILERDDVKSRLPDVNLPKVELPNRLPDLEKVPELEKLPDIKRLPDVVLPDLERPDVEPLPEKLPEIGTRPELEPIDLPSPVPVNPEIVSVDDPGRQPVPTIVADAKAEKAAILAAHGGDRRAAKAELKAAQMRMVDRIKANNGANGRGNGKGRGHANR